MKEENLENWLGFPELEAMGLEPDTLNSIKEARLEAQSMIEHLDPEHINGWADLESRLRHCNCMFAFHREEYSNEPEMVLKRAEENVPALRSYMRRSFSQLRNAIFNRPNKAST